MNIKILVCYHKPSPIFANEILQPIAVGAAQRDKNALQELESLCHNAGATLLRDDSGENISALNPYFCELTAMYWAWKNLDCEYYGLFHYRRIFDFTNNQSLDMPRSEKVKYNFKSFCFGNEFYSTYALDVKSIQTACLNYDLILPCKVIDHYNKERAVSLNMYELYDKVHYSKDMDICLAYIKTNYPQMYEIAIEVLHDKPMKWHIANMFVMKKELFFEYCEWIFSVLFAVQDKINYKEYDSYQARVFGFLSERLFNVWIEYKKRQDKKIKIKYFALVVLNFARYKRWLGWVSDGKVERFFVCKLRILKRVRDE